jgi:hypothetical protein
MRHAQTVPSPPQPRQAPRAPVQLPARRMSPCTFPFRNCTSPVHSMPSRADTRGAAPSCRHTQTRAAPFTSREDYRELMASTPGRVGHSVAPTVYKCLPAPEQPPVPAALSPAHPPTSAEARRSTRRAAGASAYTPNRSPEQCSLPQCNAHCRAESERAAPSRRSSKGTRRTFEEPSAVAVWGLGSV